MSCPVCGGGSVAGERRHLGLAAVSGHPVLDPWGDPGPGGVGGSAVGPFRNLGDAGWARGGAEAGSCSRGPRR